MLRARWPVLFLGIVGCADAAEVRLVVGIADTVIVNGRGSVPLAARLVDTNGVERKARGVHYRLVAGGAVKMGDDGRVTCVGAGDAELEARSGELATRVTVLCRPIQGFRMHPELRLTIGAPPVPLEFGAVGLDGKPVDMLAGTVSVRDSGVAGLVDGFLQPRARGTTFVDVEAGDCAVAIPVEVFETSATTEGLSPHARYTASLSMAAGELRSWRVPPGRYEIRLFDAAGAPAHLRLASYQMNCAAFPGTEQQYSCIAKDRASVVVHHTEPAGQGRQATATLQVHRRGDLGTEYRSRPVVPARCARFL